MALAILHRVLFEVFNFFFHLKVIYNNSLAYFLTKELFRSVFKFSSVKNVAHELVKPLLSSCLAKAGAPLNRERVGLFVESLYQVKH